MADVHLIFDEQFKRHVAPSWHPEAPNRLDAVRRGTDSAIKQGVQVASLELVSAKDETLRRAHTERHIANVKRAVDTKNHLDPDT